MGKALWDSSVGRALWDSSVGRALWDCEALWRRKMASGFIFEAVCVFFQSALSPSQILVTTNHSLSVCCGHFELICSARVHP